MEEAARDDGDDVQYHERERRARGGFVHLLGRLAADLQVIRDAARRGEHKKDEERENCPAPQRVMSDEMLRVAGNKRFRVRESGGRRKEQRR